MKVPLLDLKAQLEPLRGEIDRAMSAVLDSCQFVNGPAIVELETQLAAYCEAEHAVGVSSGTDALLIALMAEQVGPGDLVITTPFSFFATAGAVSRLGATPVFVDIDPDTCNLSAAALAQWLADNPQQADQVKAVIPVHLYGQCADMEAIFAALDGRNLCVIEDAAQAIGSACQVNGRRRAAGSLGHYGCFSFFPSKNLGAFGDGGLVTTQSEERATRLRRLRNHGANPKYYHAMIGGNFRLDALQAAILTIKFQYLEAWHAARREHAAYYTQRLRDLAPVELLRNCDGDDQHIYNQFVIRVPRRDELRAHLTERGVGTEVYYPVPFHLQECFAYLGYPEGAFPAAEAAAEQTLAIPVYPELTTSMQDYVCSCIEEFYA